MAKLLLGRKVGMTEIFEDDGRAVPVTVLSVGPCVVTRIKTDEGKDGYNAVQIAYGETSEKSLNKPKLGELKALAPHRHLRELRFDTAEEAKSYERGQVLDVSLFEGVSYVDVIGTTKGKGFTGVVKKYGFKGAKEASHGTHEYFRHAGSIGASATPARVFKNTRMAGQHGTRRRTSMNLQVVRILKDQGLMLVRGSVPGPNSGVVTVRPAVKKSA